MYFRDIGYSCREEGFIFKKRQVWDSVTLCFIMSACYVAVDFNSSLGYTFVLCTFFSL